MNSTILLVEDEAVVAMSITKRLEAHGYSIETVPNGIMAIEKVKNSPEISLILMDIHLGSGMDGTEAAQEILKSCDIPIIFLTSHSEKAFVERVRKITGYGYVLKDSGEFVLLESINMAYKLFEANKQIKQHEIELLEQVTVLKNREKRIEEYANMIDLTMEAANMAWWKMDVKTGSVDFSRRKTDMLGYSPEGFTHYTDFTDLVHPDDHEKTIRAMKLHLSGEAKRYDVTYRIKASSGSYRWFHDYGQVTKRDRNNNPLEVSGIVIDITEQKEDDDKLQKQKEEYELIFNNSINGILFTAPTGEILSANPAACKILGYSEEEIVKLGRKGIVDPSDPNLPNALEERRKHGRFRGELLFTKSTAEVIPVELNSQVFTTSDGEVRSCILLQDISEKKQKEKELIEATKRKDFLMKELNHRIKNNLHMVSSLISLKDSTIDNDLSDIKSQIDAIWLIHEKLQTSEDVTHIDLRIYLHDLLKTVFTSFTDKDIEISIAMEDMLLATKKTIPLGLLVNEIAINALKHGFTRNKLQRFSVSIKEMDNQDLEIKLSNSGKPFPEDIDVENPGTLGLQLIKSLVDQLNGSIDLQKEPHPVYTIRFPKN